MPLASDKMMLNMIAKSKNGGPINNGRAMPQAVPQKCNQSHNDKGGNKSGEHFGEQRFDLH